MIFRRFYEQGLAQASYLIGCDATGEALVVDANRDAAPYAAAAAEEKLRIALVTETHIHADFVSGSRELASLTGATLLLSAEGGPDWRYAFAEGDGARLLRDGDSFSVGRVRVDVIHTPGHTPEHVALLVTDLAQSERPVGLLSGDFVFVGDVGRPDLLERSARIVGTMDEAARTLFRSLERFRALPDFVQVWPGHGAGSACGKALGAMPQSTVGYEKIANWGLTTRDEAAFVRDVLAGQPHPPAYFAEMKRVNRDGPRILGAIPEPPRHDPTRLTPQLLMDATVVDARASERFAESHVPGVLGIPFNRSFATWSGSLVSYDRDVHLLVDDADQAARAARALAMIGFDRIAGWFGTDAMDGWKKAGRALARVAHVNPADLAPRMANGEVTVVDVREDSEWALGHLSGALHIPLGQLPARIAEVPRTRAVVLHCQGGHRSVTAASVLEGHGMGEVTDLRGGFGEWLRQGLPVLGD